MNLLAVGTALKRWWAETVVADDQAPEYTYLDRLDGLTERV